MNEFEFRLEELNKDITSLKDVEGTTISIPASEESYDAPVNTQMLVDFFIDLPFQKSWKLFLSLNITVVYILQIYKIAFSSTETGLILSYMLFRIICDCAYGIDVFMATMHKFLPKEFRVKHGYRPRSTALLMIDYISLLSLDYAYGTDEQDITIFTLVNTIRAIRVYRTFLFLFELNKYVGHNQVFLVLLKYSAFMFLIIHTLSCIWHYANKENGKIDPSTMGLPNKWLELLSPFDWYTVSAYFIGMTITGMGFGDIYPATVAGRGVSILCMIVGFFIFMGIFIGALTSVQVESYRHHSLFTTRMNLIKRDLIQHKLPKSVRFKTLQFFYAFWQQKQGVLSSRLYNALPQSLKMEVVLDQYWNAMHCSYLLCDLEIFHKRALAFIMKTEVYVEGDIIVDQGQLKASMMYILRGRVEILSEGDCESPLLMLSAGSCISEVALVLFQTSKVHIRAASYCVLQVLRRKDICRLFLIYRTLGSIITKKFQKKMNIAKVKLEEAAIKKKYEQEKPIYELQNVKEKQRRLEQEQLIPKPYTWVTEEEVEYTPKFTKRIKGFHEMYIYSKMIKETSDEFCLRTTFPWILQPDTKLVLVWETFVVFVVLSVSFSYPYYASFERYFPDHLSVYWMSVDLIYWLDILKEISTAVDIAGEDYTTIKAIIQYRKSQPLFVIDIVSVIPIEYIMLLIGVFTNTRLIIVWKLNRVLKVAKVYVYFGKLENTFIFNIAITRMIKYILMLVFGAYCFGTIFYLQACFDMPCYDKSWFAYIISEDVDRGAEFKRYMYPFYMSFYFGMAVITNTGFGDFMAVNLAEMQFMQFFYMVGVLLFSYLIADYSATLILAVRSRIEFKEMVQVIQKFLEKNSMLPSIQERVYYYLGLQWEYRDGYFIMHNTSLYFDAPQRLQDLITSAKRRELIISVPLFQELDANFIHEISCNVETYVLPPNEVVVYAGTRVYGFYIIEDGFCEEISVLTGKVERVLGPGVHFAAIEMLLEITSVSTVRTATHTRIMRISNHTLTAALGKFRDIEKDISSMIKSTQDSGAIDKLPFRDNIVFFDDFEVLQEERSWVLSVNNADYTYPFQIRLGHLKLIRIFLLRRTIMPDGNFIIWWETVRALCAFLAGLIFPVERYFMYDMPFLSYVCMVLDIMAAFDLYIRLHVCYYNKAGLLVCDPLLTAKHYLTHSFIVDLFAIFPMTFMLPENQPDTSGIMSCSTNCKNNFDLVVPHARYINCQVLILTHEWSRVRVFLILKLNMFACGMFSGKGY